MASSNKDMYFNVEDNLNIFNYTFMNSLDCLDIPQNYYFDCDY